MAFLLTESKTDELAKTFKVLSEPTRLRIVELLRQGEHCVCELVASLGLSQNLVSHHLGVLRRLGIVNTRRDSHWIYYSLNRELLEVLFQQTQRLFDPAAIGDRIAECP